MPVAFPVAPDTTDLHPLYITEARVSKFWDINGNEYVGILLDAGPAIIGHSHPMVMEAVKRQLDRRTNMQVTGQFAVELAKKVTQNMHGMELMRFCNFGFEAVQLALRAARTYTGREKYAKFEGGYNGQMDNALFSVHFSNSPLKNLRDVPSSDREMAGAFYMGLSANGIY